MVDQSDERLARIRFVLVETTHTGNLGAAARAMKTQGLSRMELVRPKQAPDAQAFAMAAGADDLLQRAGERENLDHAIADCRLVIGSSARSRSVDWPMLDPQACARMLVDEAGQGEVALLLGRESSGLTNEELGRCQYLVQIPTDSSYSSLNVAAAAQVFAYEVRRAWLSLQQRPAVETPREVASAAMLEGLFGHLHETMVQLGFADPQQSDRLERRLRRLFHRARPDEDEINILRGLLSAAQGRKHPARFDRS